MTDSHWAGLTRLLLLNLFLLCLQNNLEGADARQLDDSAYRRVFVPADSPETWPVGSQRFLPIPQADFLRLIEKNRSRHAHRPQVPVSISDAVHKLELKDGLLLGTSELAVQLPDNQTKLLWLSPMNLAVQSAVWSREPGEAATFGLWKRQEGGMEPGVVAEKSDNLLLEWRLAPTREADSRVMFTLKLPIVLPQTLELSLPANHSASLTPGQLVQTDQGQLGETRLTFQLAASGSHELQISRPSAARTKDALPLVSQTTSYQLKTPGLQVDTQFRLDARESKLTEISAQVSSGLRIVDVSIDHRSAAWQMKNVAGENRLVITRPASEYPQLLEIHGLAKFTPDVAWELPKIRMRDVGWTEGTTSLLVSPKLQLNSLNPKLAALQHIVGIADNSSAGEVFRFQEWSEDARIEVMVGQREPRLSLRSATTLDLGRDEAKAGVVAQISNLGRETFQIQAEIADEWAIESVTTTPQSALVEWHIDRRFDPSMLQLQLKRPITSESDLGVEIRARRIAGETVLPATIGQLDIVRFLDANSTRKLLLLRTRETHPLTLNEAVEKSRLAISDLSPEEAELLPGANTGTLLDVSTLNKSEVVELRPVTAQYEATIETEVQIEAETATHHYTIDCKPISGAVSTIILECDDPLPESLKWQLEGQQNAIVPVQIDSVSRQETAATFHHYELRLPNAKVDPFRLLATYSLPAKRVEECNLIRLPEASSWSGQLNLRGVLQGLQVVDQDWTPILSTPSNTIERLPLLGCYRYGPEENRQSRSKRLTVQREAELPPAPTVLAWLAEYRTLQAANGAAIHMVNYSLENMGADLVEITFPDSADLQEAWLGNRQLDPNEIGARGATRQFRLPLGLRRASLVLKYSTLDKALGDSATLQPVLLQSSFPVNLNRWILWAPEQYQIDNTAQYYSSQNYPWWKRIFGPLARSDNESVFNPTRPQQWKQLFSDPLVAQQTRLTAEELSQQLVERFQTEKNATWGGLVGDVVDQTMTSSLVVIDRTALLARGIESSTPSQTIISEVTAQRLEAQPLPLSAYGLAFLVSPNSIVLTSEDRVSHWRDQLQPTEISGMFMVDADGLANTLERVRDSKSTSFVNLAQWRQLPTSALSSWGSFPATKLADVGRHIQTVEFLQAGTSLVVRRIFVGRALWYAVLLLTLFLGVWLLAHYPNKMILVAAIAGATCLIIPIQWLTIPQAVFLGLLAAAIIRILIKSTSIAGNNTSVSRKILHALTVLFACYVCLYSNSLQAQSVSEATDSKSIKLPLVLVPIDTQGNHQGEDIYLSANFLKDLQKATSSDKLDRPEWVLQEAVYRGNLPDDLVDNSTDSLIINEPWTLQWKVVSFVANSRIALPLQRIEADWQADLHRLDGVPIKLDWLENGNGCSVVLPEAGVHWLKIAALPRVQLNDGKASLKLHIPALPGAILDLSTASGIAKLQLPFAESKTNSEVSEQQQFVLSDKGILEVNWEPKILKDKVTSWDRLEQLSWLQVDSAGTHLDVQLSLKGLRSAPHLLELEVSPQLKLVPPGEESVIEQITSPTLQNPTRLQLKLRNGLPEDVVIPLRFDLQRATTVGRIYFPRVRLVDLVPDQRLFAVSVSAGLSYDESIRSFLRSIEPAEFSTLWKTATDDPLYAYALGQEDPDWALRVWPDPQTIAAQQTVRVFCSANSADVEFEAAMDKLTGSWLSHKILVPKPLVVDAVTVENLTDLSKVPVRWSRTSETEVVVFMGRPLSDPHLLQLRGHIDVTTDSEIEIPKVQLLSNDRSEIHLDLYRTDNVQVRWVDAELSFDEIPQQQISQNSSEIHVAHFSWRSSETAPLAQLRIEQNEQIFDVASLTTVDLGLAGWSAALSARVKVRKGIVHRLDIEVPEGFLGPYTLEPAQIGIINAIEDSPTGRKITLLLAKPAVEGEEFELQLGGSLKLAANQRLVIPSLRWKGATYNDHFVQLPSMVNEQPMEWQTSGLRRTKLPQKLQAFSGGHERVLTYHVEQTQFQAAERSFRGTLRNALIRSAKVSGTLDRRGLMTATAELILQPGRATSCAIQLPESAELTQLVIGDRPARREMRTGGRWKVMLGPAFMPRRILVSYHLQCDLDEERIQLTPPQVFIGDQALPTPQTLWRINPTTGLQLGKSLAGKQLDAARFYDEDHRLVAQTLEDAQVQASELPEEEERAWLQTWQKIAFQAESTRLTYNDANSSELAKPEDVLLDSEMVSSMNYPPALPITIGSTLEDPVHYYLSNPRSQLVLEVQSYSLQKLWQWFAAVALICGTWAVVLKLRDRPQWHQELCRWPHSLALSGGLCWWLLLKPSAAGLLVVALALTSLAIKKWQQLERQQLSKPDTQLTSPAS